MEKHKVFAIPGYHSMWWNYPQSIFHSGALWYPFKTRILADINTISWTRYHTQYSSRIDDFIQGSPICHINSPFNFIDRWSRVKISLEMSNLPCSKTSLYPNFPDHVKRSLWHSLIPRKDSCEKDTIFICILLTIKCQSFSRPLYFACWWFSMQLLLCHFQIWDPLISQLQGLRLRNHQKSQQVSPWPRSRQPSLRPVNRLPRNLHCLCL